MDSVLREGRWVNFINASPLDTESCFNINVDFVPVVTYRPDCYLKKYSLSLDLVCIKKGEEKVMMPDE